MRQPNFPNRQRGVTVVVILMLLAVMLLGWLSLSRMSELGTLVAGNISARNTAIQASEVATNTAFADLKAMTAFNANSGNWYFASMQPQTSDGMPNVSFSSARSRTVGAYTASYVVERVCDALPVTDEYRQCLIKQVPVIKENGSELEDPFLPQFRISVQVAGPKNTTVLVQSLVTKGF